MSSNGGVTVLKHYISLCSSILLLVHILVKLTADYCSSWLVESKTLYNKYRTFFGTGNHSVQFVMCD